MKNGHLFENIIQSIGFDQHEILRNIISLHCRGGFDVDSTYGLGGFYKAGVPYPRYCFDLNPRDPRAKKADCRALPLERESVESMIFDPPFLFAGGKNGRMADMYGVVDTMSELVGLYTGGMAEAHRILKPQGILVVKCQDITNGRKELFVHCDVYQAALMLGFRPVDLFLKLNKTAMIPNNYENQQHARKMHSYFWVFKKPGRRK